MVKMTVSAGHIKHTAINNSTVKKYKGISLAREFQKQLLGPSHRDGVTDQGRYREWAIQ